MIYTVTFNPSLDYIVSVDDFTCGIVNRTTDEIIFPGGKGINVSMVLKNLGFENTALGFLAGFTGNRIQELLEEKGVRTDFISVEKGDDTVIHSPEDLLLRLPQFSDPYSVNVS